MKITVGLTGEMVTTVTDVLLASRMGSGSLDVYATPALIALIEAAAVSTIDPLLPDGQASVGVALDVKHLAATPPGAKVRAQVEVIEIEGRKVRFAVQAWDEHELIGKGTHTRYVIDTARFIKRIEQKQ